MDTEHQSPNGKKKTVKGNHLEHAWDDFYRTFLLPAAQSGKRKVTIGPDSDLKFGHAFHGLTTTEVKRLVGQHNVHLRVRWLSLPTYWYHQAYEMTQNWTTFRITVRERAKTNWTQEVNCTFYW
mmetsp:Transcript_128037/g.246688  ORF Transcript_128037/g.246688 Transcript_128037/m.246688 type:complete len:124 (-) Transcript_128037:63-434(-)